MKTTFKCYKCKLVKPILPKGGTGYAIDKHNHHICYDCCAIEDYKQLDLLTGKNKMYLYFDGKQITNWPGTLRINPYCVRKGNHNICRSRYDVYFKYNGKDYHGLNLGDNQILHVNKLKS